MKIRETRTLAPEGIRALCHRKYWMTEASPKQMERLMEMVISKELTAKTIQKMARYIHTYTNFVPPQRIEQTMAEIASNATYKFIILDERKR